MGIYKYVKYPLSISLFIISLFLMVQNFSPHVHGSPAAKRASIPMCTPPVGAAQHFNSALSSFPTPNMAGLLPNMPFNNVEQLLQHYSTHGNAALNNNLARMGANNRQATLAPSMPSPTNTNGIPSVVPSSRQNAPFMFPSVS